MRSLPASMLRIRSDFLRDVRSFFFQRDYLEIETPLMNPTGGVDPFLDPLRVRTGGVRKSVEAPDTEGEHDRWLITSPEYNLKILLADSPANMFQIAHCFREGDTGALHTEEFLMLEWYRLGIDEFELMRECRQLLEYLAGKPYSRVQVPPADEDTYRSTETLMRAACDCGITREELEQATRKFGLLGPGEEAENLRFDELFFTLFLNRAEANLGLKGPQFIHDYPREMAALAVVERDIARRFECYWQGVELANGYYELRSRAEQEARFHRENLLRRELGKTPMTPDPAFIAALDRGLPECSGIALGLDRLLMVLLGHETLAEISPFFHAP